MVVHIIIAVLERLKQEDQEVKASLCYSVRPVSIAKKPKNKLIIYYLKQQFSNFMVSVFLCISYELGLRF
jgi:hypothetical protein